jgi:hypothetical protein
VQRVIRYRNDSYRFSIIQPNQMSPMAYPVTLPNRRGNHSLSSFCYCRLHNSPTLFCILQGKFKKRKL